MPQLNLACLNTIDPKAFNDQKPFPWVNPSGVLLDEAYRQLVDTLPDVSTFGKSFGEQRKYGQNPHNRFLLEYNGRTPLPDPWKAFVHELRQPPYRQFLQEMFGVKKVALRFHWLYTPAGCSVSPHCDGADELGTHLFYFNTAQDWDPAWGGSTLILDDGQRLSYKTAPSFEDFARETPSQSIGNYSLLFKRTDHSWHGVRELRCPQGRLRKLFSVIVLRDERSDRFTRLWDRTRYKYF
jgi:hypothetical protein